MSIRKRSWTNARGEQLQAWAVDYRDGAGKRRSKQFARKRDAEAWSTQAAYQVSQGTHTPDAQSVTVAQAADLWVKRAEDEKLERSTVEAYSSLARLHVVPLLGATKLSRLTRPMVEKYRDELVTSRSRAMAAKGVRALSSILSEAQRRGLVAQNAAAAVKVKRPSRDEQSVEIPTKAEIRAMLDAADRDFRPMLMTAAVTGLRASELRGLRWSDIDLKAATITVSQRADRWGKIGAPKSKAGHRTVPIPQTLVSELREWRLRCPKGVLGLAFPNASGDVLDHMNLLKRRYRPTQARAGLAGRFGFHALRHAAASAWINQGIDLKRLQVWIGHENIQLTLDTYGHLLVDKQADADLIAKAETDLFG